MLDVDLMIFHFVNYRWAMSWLDPIMVVLSNTKFWLGVGVGLWLVARWKRVNPVSRSFFLVVTLGIALLDGFNGMWLKPKVGRIRPCHELARVRNVNNYCGGLYSFPSNHSANAGAIATILSLVVRRAGFVVLFGFLAFSVGYSRVYLGVHYPGDVLVGLLQGALWGYCVFKAARFIETKRLTSTSS